MQRENPTPQTTVKQLFSQCGTETCKRSLFKMPTVSVALTGKDYSWEKRLVGVSRRSKRGEHRCGVFQSQQINIKQKEG